jgi:hypothetical protein
LAALILPSPVLPHRPTRMLASLQYPRSCHLAPYLDQQFLPLLILPSSLATLTSNCPPNSGLIFTSFTSSRSSLLHKCNTHQIPLSPPQSNPRPHPLCSCSCRCLIRFPLAIAPPQYSHLHPHNIDKSLSFRSSSSLQIQYLVKFLLSSLHSNPSSFRLPCFNAATPLSFVLMSLPVNAQAAQPPLRLSLCRPFVLPTHPPLSPPTLPERAGWRWGDVSTAWGPRLVGRSIEGMGRSGMEARDCEEGCAGPLPADF